MKIKTNLTRILLGVVVVVIGLYLGLILLTKSGYLYVGISPYAHYQLNETETKLIENWIADFHKNVAEENYQAIREKFINDKQSRKTQNDIVQNAIFAYDKYGKIDFTKIFRSMPPEPSSGFYGKDIDGKVYGLIYHSNAERGMLSENYELVIHDNKKVSLWGIAEMK